MPTSNTFGVTVTAQAWSYPGIPYISDDVPNTVTQLTGAVPSGPALGNSWGYDPTTLTKPTPTPGGAANEYYVDLYNGNNSTAGQGGQGSDVAPRLTMPSYATVFSPGDVIFVKGQGTALPPDSTGSLEMPPNSVYREISPDQTWKNRNIIGMQGTQANPIWIVGIDLPRLPPEIELVGASNVIIDGVVIETDGTNRNGSIVIRDSSDRVCFRNGAIYGLYLNGGGALFYITESDFVCLYNSELAYGGIWDDHVSNLADVHTVLPGRGARWVWIIDNELHETSGDGMQVTGSLPNTDSTTTRAQYIYFGGNTCYGFRENVIDCKTSFHVIVSSNVGYDNPGAATGGGYAFYVNNEEGDASQIVSSYHWFINNTCYDADVAFGGAANHEGAKTYFIGNVAYDCNTAGWPMNFGNVGSRTIEQVWVNNTAVRCTEGLDYAAAAFWGSLQPNISLRMAGNLTYDCSTLHVSRQGDAGSEILNYHAAAEPVGSATITTTGWTSATGNIVDQDLLLTDSANNDFTLQPGSAAQSIVPTKDAVYNLFNSIYGISIQTDIAGTAIPSINLNAGAYQ